MPKIGPGGTFVPITLPQHVTAMMPDPVAVKWAAYQRALDQWKTAERAAVKARAAADAAPDADQAAAMKAVEQGRPIPKPTVDKLAAAAETAHREVEPRRSLAGRAERDYIATATEHRAEWLGVALERVSTAATEARDVVNSAEIATAEAVQAFAVWRWLRFADRLDRAPTGSAPPAFGDIRAALDTLDPALVEEQVAADQVEAERAAAERRIPAFGQPM